MHTTEEEEAKSAIAWVIVATLIFGVTLLTLSGI